jgi:hypothetical protein
MRLLVASDVNWDIYVRDAAKSVLRDQSVTGVQVPDSHVITNPDLASTQAMASVWRGLHGASVGGTPTGKHGSALVSVTALPDGKKPKSIVQHKTIDVINAGETKTVTFTDLGNPPFGVPTTLKADIQPVAGETTISNNSAEYKVIFSLP